MKWSLAALGAAAVAGTVAHDVTQRQHAIVRNFPVVGHLRFFLERFGPELRQYIVTSNDEERPFSRDQRRWVYASSKLENNYFGFGTDNDMEHVEGYPIIKHRTFMGPGAATMPHADEEIALPSAKVMGAARGRRHAFRPGVGGQHLRHELRLAVRQGDRVAQQGRGHGRLPAEHRRGRAVAVPPQRRRHRLPDRHQLLRLPRRARPLRPGPAGRPGAVGAGARDRDQALARAPSPAWAACCRAEKVSAEIAEIRGIPEGKDCASPSRHEVFHDVDSMLDFVETSPTRPGCPVGIKSAVGNMTLWDQLVEEMVAGRARRRLRQHRRRRGRHRARRR